jgi:hypothetical protein
MFRDSVELKQLIPQFGSQLQVLQKNFKPLSLGFLFYSEASYPAPPKCWQLSTKLYGITFLKLIYL